jgi:hypothetical protein
MEMRLCSRSKAVAKQTEYDAEEPNPAPIGRLVRAVSVNDGLKYAQINIMNKLDLAVERYSYLCPSDARNM